jgi:glycerol-3-phosphate dehydrogenase
MPPTLRRDLQTLSAQLFDLLVIGGGIYGLTTACDAAQRGLAVALIERSDIGSGTSFNHLRTIHGGLRYLQTLDLARARESVRERRTIARIAPWAVRPVPFVLPLHRSLARGVTAMRVAFLLDAIVSGDRNKDVAASHRLPAGRVVSRDEAERLYPEISGLDTTGAAVWYDYVTIDADRLTFSWALAASQRGATLANYVTATAVTEQYGLVTGATAMDTLTGQRLQIRARSVVNATGSQLNNLLAPFHGEVDLPLLQAINLVTRRQAPSAAMGGRTASGRTLFVVPWAGRALFGTWESTDLRKPGDTSVRDADVADFITGINQAFPATGLTHGDVTLVHRGLVPARVRAGRAPALDGRELVFEHRAEGLGGMISVAGTKYTTARAVAERIVDRVFQLLGRETPPCVSNVAPLPHVNLAGDDLLRHAAANEMVMTLADAVVRRTPLGALGCPPDEALAHAAQVVGTELDWSADRQRDEARSVRGVY